MLVAGLAGLAAAQAPSEGDTTTPPLATPGHAVILGPHEAVNPANGSVSLSFPVAMPKGRQLTVPFSIFYSSNGARFVTDLTPGAVNFHTQSGPFMENGWSYTIPRLTYAENKNAQPNGPGSGPTCDLFTNYVFTDVTGQPHSLNLSVALPDTTDNPCGTDQSGDYEEDWTGNEGPVSATLPNSLKGSVVRVSEPDGTIYGFNTNQIAAWVTDRNGNSVSMATNPETGDVTYTDTLGRGALVTDGFNSEANTIAVSGTNGYSLTWSTQGDSFSETATDLSVTPGGTCNTALSSNQTNPVVTSLTTPDGTYQFEYESTFGLLSRITYPNGGYISYIWTLEPNSEVGSFDAGYSGEWLGEPPSCVLEYGVPMITERDLSQDGQNPQQRQTFSYVTNWGSGGWTSKTTTVTTTDLTSNKGFQTVYTYSPFEIGSQPNSAVQLTTETPVEATVQVDDYSGNPLRTVQETWYGMPLVPATQTTTLDNNKTSEVVTDYNFSTLEPTEKDEHAYGQGSPGAIVRKTITNYASFPGTGIVSFPSSVEVEDGSGNQQALTNYYYDQTTPQATSGVEQHGVVSTPRGNLTTLSRWLNTTGASLSTTLAYDDTGQLLATTDPNGNTTQYSYAVNFDGGGEPGNTNAYVTAVTPPNTAGCPQNVNCHVENYSWFYAGGQMATAEDFNGNQTGYVYSDPWGRLTQINQPDGGESTFTYTPSTLESKRLITGSTWTDDLETFNGLGWPGVDAHTNGNSGWDRVETCFDGFGNKSDVTYPFPSSNSGGAAACTQPGDTLAWDALHRETQVTHADGSSINMTYVGAAVETADEGNGAANVTRITQTDALGQLAAVCEVTGGNYQDDLGNYAVDCGLDVDRSDGSLDGLLTAYNFNVLGDVTNVDQEAPFSGDEVRSFGWDSLGRLLSASNPETGNPSFTWDGDGNLLTRAQANGVTTTYTWDALNRQTSRSFTVNGNPDSADQVNLFYDSDPTGITTYGAYNHITRVTNGSPVVLSFPQYDPSGRAQVLDTYIGTTKYHSSVAYDMIGFPTWEWLASGRQLYLDEDVAGRAVWIADATYGGDGHGNYPYLEDRYYNSDGSPADEDLGNGLHQGWHEDSRLRVTGIDVYPTGNYNWSTQRMDESIAYNPDSTVAGITDQMGSAAQNLGFTLDPLNRLSGWSNGAGLSCPLQLDEFGNTVDASGNSNCGMLTGVTFNAQNQITGDVYDGSGQILSDTAGTSYAWNVEGELSGFQLTGQPAAGYVYDGLGRRAEKTSNGSVTATYFYNALGDLTSELDGGTFTDFIYAPAGALGDSPEARIAAVVGAGGVSPISYYHTDPLGTTRALSDGGGNNLASCGQNANYPDGSFLTYAPFGAEVGGCTQSTTPFKFTGKYRDLESSLGDFGARYYSSSLGRFMTPDWSESPEPIPYANLSDPQSFNLYSYAGNNPATETDADGHVAFSSLMSQGYGSSATCGIDGTSNNGCSTPIFGSGCSASYCNSPLNFDIYDSNKWGPEDPTNPGKPLYWNPIFRKASDRAFELTQDGNARDGLAEAGFSIDLVGFKIVINNWVSTVNSGNTPNDMAVPFDNTTIAILHTHGNRALPTPGPLDPMSRFPNYVRSARALYVTIPSTRGYILLPPYGN